MVQSDMQDSLSRINTQKGLGTYTVIVFGLIIGVLVFCGYQILPFYYYYFELQSHMEQMVKVASEEPDREIRKRLMYYIKKYELPIEQDELRIERIGGMIRITLDYEEVFYITFRGKDYDLHVFKFHAAAEGKI